MKVSRGTPKGRGSIKRKPEVYYRSMSMADYKKFKRTGRLPATSETMITPSRTYASRYRGVLVRIIVKRGTKKALVRVGFRDDSRVLKRMYPNMRYARGKRWTRRGAYFKREKPYTNIGLGRGRGLRIFNRNILKIMRLR